MSKINCNPSHPPLFPISPIEDARPFETIALDFITKLPPSGGYDTILTITDTDCSKASIFLPCNKTIDSEGVATLYAIHVTPYYGIPRKVISDRDIHFTSKFTTDLCHLLDIQQNISTAYHPQTDGASERTNQTLEQYLQIFCSTQQDNWHTWLPLAQYTKNSWPSATTKKTPFDLLIGYTCCEFRQWTVMSYDDVWTLTFHPVYSLFILWNTKRTSLYYSQYRTIVPSVLSFETEVSIVFSYVQCAVANQ